MKKLFFLSCMFLMIILSFGFILFLSPLTTMAGTPEIPTLMQEKGNTMVNPTIITDVQTAILARLIAQENKFEKFPLEISTGTAGATFEAFNMPQAQAQAVRTLRRTNLIIADTDTKIQLSAGVFAIARNPEKVYYPKLC